MPPALPSSLLKLKRAREQLSQLKSDIDAFLKRQPYGVTFKLDAEKHQVVATAKVREHPPETWSVLIGEFLHNVRSALDYMVWDLVWLETNAAPVTNKVQFPIFLTKAGYDQRTKEYLRGVGSRARRVIENAQPFKTGEDVRSPLWQLHELSNWDKHRSLHLSGATLQGAKLVTPPMTAGLVSGTAHVTAPGPFDHGTVLFRLQLTGTAWFQIDQDTKSEADSNLTCDIAFDQRSPIAGAIVTLTLERALARVARIGTSLSELWPAIPG